MAPTTESPSDLSLDLVEMQGKIANISQDVSEIKEKVNEIASLDKTMAQLTIHSANAKEQLDSTWKAIDTLRANFNAVDAKVEAIRNSWKAGVWVAGIFFGLGQIFVASGIVWLISTTNDNRIVNNIQEYQIGELIKDSENNNRSGVNTNGTESSVAPIHQSP